MRNHRKAAKKRAHHADYVRKRNINKYAPKVTHHLRKPVYRSETKDGVVTLEKIGDRDIIKKGFPPNHRQSLKPGDGILPRSKKFDSGTPKQKPVPEYREQNR